MGLLLCWWIKPQGFCFPPALMGHLTNARSSSTTSSYGKLSLLTKKVGGRHREREERATRAVRGGSSGRGGGALRELRGKDGRT
jgi:hypothetical protein